MKRLFLTPMLLSMLAASAQNSLWNVAEIPDSLRQGVYSVIRCNEITFKQTGTNSGSRSHCLAVTILSDQGDSHASWAEYTNAYSDLTSFEGRIYNAEGKAIGRIRQKDLSHSEYTQALMTDAVTHFYIPDKQAQYPYTIEYRWEVKINDGIAGYLNKRAVSYSKQSAQESVHQIIVPSGEINTLALNTTAQWQCTQEGKLVHYTFRMPAFSGLKVEDMMPDDWNVVPCIAATPKQFSIENHPGQLNTWQHFGDWIFQLYADRQELLPSDRDTVLALTSGLDTQRAKVEALYKYLARKTRYVSIQLGIGGWRPMAATEVGRTGFGDCKALANYMLSLLQEAGIQSHPVVISTTEARYLEEFPNFYQNNHAILCIPMSDEASPSDTLWMDCTAANHLLYDVINPALRGHDCLVLRPEGTLLTRVPEQPISWTTRADIQIGKNLKTQCKATETDYNGEEKEIKKEYGKVLGSRTLLIPLDPYTKVVIPQFRKDSTFPICRSQSKHLTDSIFFHLDPAVQLESVPDLSDAASISKRLTLGDEPIHWQGQTLLDEWQIDILRTSDGFCIVLNLKRQAGTRPAQDKDIYREQCKRLAEILDAKLIFKNKEN